MEQEKKSVLETGQVLLFDKPYSWTSFDLVNKLRVMIRSALGLRKIKVGHAGTLDPLATGLMIVCTGGSTKRISEFMGLPKEYIAGVTVGKTTSSYDLETEVNGEFPVSHITRELIFEKLKQFEGEQLQIPPLHSAKFINGKRAYEFARKGVDKELEPVKVVFHEIELLDFNDHRIDIRILCSKGTYIRSFARDLGTALGSGAYLSSLRRTAIGKFRIEEAMDLEKFNVFLEQMKQK